MTNKVGEACTHHWESQGLRAWVWPSVNSHVECLLCVWGALGAPPPTSLQMRELALPGIK